MTVLGVKLLQSDHVTNLQWSGTMDLLLANFVTNSHSDLVIHRLNWSKLPFQLGPITSPDGKKKPALLHSVSWSPDGTTTRHPIVE